MNEELIGVHLTNLAIDEYGSEAVGDILIALNQLENGTCGCELACSTLPRLLEMRGVEPERTYVEEFGVPPQDGVSAATADQRKIIWDTIENLGYPMHDSK